MKALRAGYLLRDDGVIEINPDIVYRGLMAELGLTFDRLDQYWLGVIRTCAVIDGERLIQGTEHDRRSRGIALQVHILSGTDKRLWQLKSYPVGKGEALAETGGEGRRHFERLWAKRARPSAK